MQTDPTPIRQRIEAHARANRRQMEQCQPRTTWVGADLSEADLSGADLSEADLSGANLIRAYLNGANFSRANLRGADLSGATLSGAYLSGANLSGANLRGADLSGADIGGADLRSANLSGAHGIRTAGPVGLSYRMIYGLAHNDEAMIQCGRWWGTLSATLDRVATEYAGRPELEDYLAAVRWVGGVK